MTNKVKELPLTKSRKHQYLASCTVCLAGLSAATTLAWTSPVLPELEAANSHLHITRDQGTWIASVGSFGMIFSALVFGPLSNPIGRKYALTIFAVPLLVGYMLIPMATNVLTIYIARILMGIGNGGIMSVTPIYITEITETDMRGSCGVIFAIFFQIGLLLTNVLGGFMNYITLSVTLALMPLLFIILFQFIPDSPVFLIMSGQLNKAKTAIQWLRGEDCDIDSILEELNNQIEIQNSYDQTRISDLFTSTVNRNVLFSCLGLFMFEQLNGHSAILSYTVFIFQLAGTDLDPHLEAIIVSSVSLFMSVCVFKLINTMGRKFFLMLSGGLMAVCTGGLGLYFQLKDADKDVSYLNWLPLTTVMLSTAAFSIGFAAIPRILTNESVLPQFRSYVMAMATTTGCICQFTVTKTFELLKETIGNDGTFYTYTIFSALSIIWVYFLVTETRGKTLEEVQLKLNNRYQRKMIRVVV